MYKDIPGVEPLNGDITIWRYMDLASFMSLVLEKQLMFRRTNCFKDVYDTFVDLDSKSIESIIKALKDAQKSPNSFIKIHEINPKEEETSDGSMSIKQIQPFWTDNGMQILFDATGNLICLSDMVYCSSWHENDHENYALWKIYLGNKPEGVAIKTSVKKICNILNNQSNDFFIGRIDYDSSKKNIFNEGLSNHAIILRKKKEYEYEKEIRIYTIEKDMKNSQPYLYLPITNMEDFVEELWISPFVGNWFSETIHSFIKQNNLNIKVEHSSIKER